MATPIAQAFVQVRPDLTGFSRALRTQLKTSMDAVSKSASTKLVITPVLAKGSKAALQKQLSAMGPLKLTVEPTITKASVGALRRKIGTIENVPITLTIARGQVEKVRTEVAQAAALATSGAGAAALPGAASAAGAVGVGAAKGTEESAALAVQEARVAAAVEQHTKARLNKIAVEQKDAATVAELELAQAALLTTETKLTAEQELLAVARTRAINPAVTADELAQKAAADALAASTAGIAEAMKLRTIAAKQAAKASVDLGTIDQARLAVDQALARIDKELAAAQAINNEAGISQLNTMKLYVERQRELLIAKSEYATALQEEVHISDAASGRVSTLARLNAELAQAEDALAAATRAAEAAQNSQYKSIQRLTLARQEALATRVSDLRVARDEAVLARQRAPLDAAISSAQRSIAAGQDAALSARGRLTTLARAERDLTAAITQHSKATDVARTEDIARLEALRQQTRILIQNTEAEIAHSTALKRTATQQAQATRGALATSATFLGLRGAVLSSTGAFLAATVAVTALAKIVQTAAELQRSLNVFRAVSGATADQMKAVEAEAKALGADLTLPATSANDAAQAMTELAKAGLSVDDSLAAARGVLQLAAAAQVDVATASKITATELNAFGLEGTKATHVADLLAGAANQAQGEITDFALAFQQASAVAHQIQLPIETTTAVLTQFARAGLRGSDAGTSLRTLLLRLAPTTKAAADAQEQLGIKINDSIPIGEQFVNLVNQYNSALKGLTPVAQQQILTKIFGQDAIRGASIVFTQGSRSLLQLQDSVDQSGQAADFANARMKGLSGAVEGLQSSIQTLAGQIGEPLLPALESITRALAGVTQTAGSTVSALNAVGKVTIKPVTDVLGGPDTIAQIGLALGAGLGGRALARKGLEARVERERATIERNTAQSLEAMQALVVSASQAEVAATLKVADGWKTSAAAAAASGKTQVTFANEVTAALRRQGIMLDLIVAEYEKATVASGRFARAQALAARGLKGLAGGIGLGVGLSVAGSFLPGTAGTVAGAAGTGAILGSFVPVPGATLIGAGLFGGIAALQASRAATKRRQEEIKAEWQSMTFEEQQDFLRQNFPEEASPNAQRTAIQDLLARTKKPEPTGVRVRGRTGAPVKPVVQTAEDFVKQQGGFNITADDFRKASEIIKNSLPDTSSTLNDIARTVPLPTTGLGQQFANRFFDPVAQFLKSAGVRARQLVQQAQADRELQLQLNAALAQYNGDTAGADAAINELIALNKKQIESLLRQVNATLPGMRGFVLSDKERQKKMQEIITLIQKDAQLTAQLSDASKSFSVSLKTTIAGINAGATETLVDDLANKQQVFNETTAALNKELAKKSPDQSKVDDLRKQQAQARADVITTGRSLNQQQQQAANQEIQNALTRLQIAADTAGNLGAAERKYIAALKARVADKKLTDSEQLAAEQAYNQEVEKAKNAQQALIQARQGLIDARLQTALALAQQTDTKKDDIRVFNQMITRDKARIAALKKVVNSAKSTASQVIDAQTKIEGLRQDIIDNQAKIKDAAGGGSGFSLSDLFNEAVKQFQEFGSNVAGRSGLFTGGDVRGSFSASIINQAKNPVADAVMRSGRQQLTEAEKQTSLMSRMAVSLELISGRSDRRQTRVKGEVENVMPLPGIYASRQVAMAKRGVG